MTLRDHPVGILFLGCGWAAEIHSRALRRMRDVRLYYASRGGGAARATAMCARFGGRCAFASYEAGLSHAGVDVAVVATPPATHLELALLALAHRKHVIVEKPAFVSPSDVEVVRAAAADAGRRVLVAENYVYKPVAELLRRRIGAGDLGDVRFVHLNATKRQAASGWRGNPAVAGGGALFEAGIHWVSFAASLGLEVVDAQGFPVGTGAGTDRSSLVVLRYANGAAGTILHSWELTAPFGGLRLSKIQGTLGAVTFESNGLAAVSTGRRRSVTVLALRDPLGYRAMHADFLWALRTGAPALYTLEMAERDLWLVEQATLGIVGHGRPLRQVVGCARDVEMVAP